MQQLAFILPQMGAPEMLIIGMVALLIFGKRLPEVARNMGKGIVEFKKGIKGIEDEIDTSSRPAIATQPPVSAIGQDTRVSQAAEPVAPKVEADQGSESSE